MSSSGTPSTTGIHLTTLGHRIRHHRTANGLTLDELGAQVFGEAQHEVFLGRDYANHQDYSAETADHATIRSAFHCASKRRRTTV